MPLLLQRRGAKPNKGKRGKMTLQLEQPLPQGVEFGFGTPQGVG